MSQKSYNWNTIQDHLAENSQAGMLMAILEADKILISVIRDLGYPSKNNKQRLCLAQKLFSDFNRVKEAHNLASTIKKEVDFSLSPKLTEEILAVYYQALLDIKEHKKPRFVFWQKGLFYLEKKALQAKKLLKWLGLYIFIFFLIVLILDKTKFGNKIVAVILKITDFIFSWFLIIVLLIFGIAAITFSSIWYFKSRRKIDIDISGQKP